jgi:two-component system response regulator PilR (NtrC family)
VIGVQPSPSPGRVVLVIDDEEVMRDVLQTLLQRAGYAVQTANGGAEGLALARRHPFDAVIVDVMMPDIDGLQVLEALRQEDDALPVLVITAYASMDTAVRAMQRGAFDYITKPFKHEEVLTVLGNAIEQRRLREENRHLRAEGARGLDTLSAIVGRSPQMLQVFKLIAQAAPSRTTVLITGESGTGKELVARALHVNSTRADKAFVPVNSGNLPPDLLESTLFGHVKGAFTGAVAPKKGLFDLADQGTIFFDEIGNVPVETQAKLLRVMQEREFMRLGGMDTIRVDVRIIAATNVNLKDEMEAGRFREDLFYRLQVITIELPPLRSRTDDIPLLVHHFLDKYARDNGRAGMSVTPEALDLLVGYAWPGNVRELENVIERAVVLSVGPVVTADRLPDAVRGLSAGRAVRPVALPPDGISLRDEVDAYERQWIEAALAAADGVQKRAAELLRIRPTTLNEMLKRHGLRDRARRQDEADDPPVSG